MNMTELELLANVANHNEDVLKNKTTKLRDEVRDWCIAEMTKIEDEEKKLLDFVNKNHSLFCDRCGTPYFYKYGMCYANTASYGSRGIFTNLLIDMSKTNYVGFESYWQSASVHGWTTSVQGCFDCMNGDIEYWTRMKKCIDFRWWQLGKMCEKCKEIINDGIHKQNERMGDIVNVCNDIDKANKNVEVTISVKVGGSNR